MEGILFEPMNVCGVPYTAHDSTSIILIWSKNNIVIMAMFQLLDVMTSYCFAQQQQAWLTVNVALLWSWISVFVSALQHSFTPGNQVILVPPISTYRYLVPLSHVPTKDTCPRKVGQRLGIPLIGGWGYPWALFHTSISVCSGPLLSWNKPPQAKMMCRYRHSGEGGGGQGA